MDKVDDLKVEKILRLHGQGMTIRDIALEVGVSKTSVANVISKYRSLSRPSVVTKPLNLVEEYFAELDKEKYVVFQEFLVLILKNGNFGDFALDSDGKPFSRYETFLRLKLAFDDYWKTYHNFVS